MNCAVSSFRSHFGQTGNGTAQTFPPGEKNVASTYIMADPHLAQGARDSLGKEPKSVSVAE